MVRSGLDPLAKEVAAEVVLNVRITRAMAEQIDGLRLLCAGGDPYRWGRVSRSDVVRHALGVGLARMSLDLETETQLEVLSRALAAWGEVRR